MKPDFIHKHTWQILKDAGRILSLCVLLFQSSFTAGAQNLIPNPSFEIQVSCPVNIDGFYFPSQGERYVRDWFWPSTGTSDYYSACANDSIISVPYNFIGYQDARTGSSYAGGLVENMGNEYLESPLSSVLIAGHHYYVRYWLNTANNSWGGADRFGAYFSQNAVELPNALVLDMLIPQVESPAGQIFSDTIGWSSVTGIYTALGGEQWLTIGNFHAVPDLDTIAFREETGFGAGPMYFYYDDVCVLDMDGAPAHLAVSDTTLCGASSIVLNAPPGRGNYYWSDGSTNSSIEVQASGSYWVKSIDLASCALHVDSFNIAGVGDVVPLHIGYDTSICPGQSIVLHAGSEMFSKYQWSNGATTASTEVNAPGVYTVTAFSDCVKGIDSIIVSLSENCNCLFMPNAFSPNGDQLNDILKVELGCVVGFFQLDIFNRFGERVFTTNDPARGWNGTYKGRVCDGGVYFYNLHYAGPGTSETMITERKGDIVLLR